MVVGLLLAIHMLIKNGSVHMVMGIPLTLAEISELFKISYDALGRASRKNKNIETEIDRRIRERIK
jgi:uncharacterized membrane protein YccF (DUF307 family)